MDKKRDLSIYRMQNAKDTLDTILLRSRST